jgi:hypothetical protein
MCRLSFPLALVAAVAWATSAAAADIVVEKTDSGVNVKVGDQPFATYVFQSKVKPILWPIIGPTGKEMTRAWPMREGNPEEKKDHPHQRSMWFTHGEVNGIDFWAETAKVQGRIEHKELVKAEGGKTGTIVTRSEWVGPDGGKHLSDEQTIRFGADEASRWIDCDIRLTFGLRIPGTMEVDRNMGGKMGGRIITSEGLTDKDAWGKPASWVDYHGPVQGEILGIAILNHPSSFRYPNGWHVRTYGLFAANPFGEGDFRGQQVETSYTMKKGESLTFRYRVIFHKGDEKEGKIAEAFAKYAKE